MKPSNCDLEDLWQGIAHNCEQRQRRIPAYLRLARRAYSAILMWAWWRRA